MEDIRMAGGKYMQVPINEKTLTTELSGDFTLPDYQPEIKRLLKVSAEVLPPQKYVGDSEGEISGGIDYYVLYTGSDNQIYCAPLSSEYKVSVPMDKNELSLVNMTADAEIAPESVSGRVTSPRKLNIKCRLRTRARMYGDMPIDSSYAALGGETQVLMGREETSRRIFSQSEMIRLSDEMILPATDGETRVINATGRVHVTDCTASNGAVNAKGELYLKMLMCRETDGVPYATMRRIPFNTTVSVDGADTGCETSAKGKTCEMSINVEDGRISIDAGIMLELSLCKTDSVTYVKDIYSTERETSCEYRDIPFLRDGRALNSNFTQSDSMTLEDAGLSPEHKLIDIEGHAHAESATLDGGRWIFTGKTRFSLLCEKDGEYMCSEIEMPYRYTVESKQSESDDAYASATAEVINARARLDGERIGVDAEVTVCCVISSKDEARMLDNASFGEEKEKSRGEYVVCYPSREDSLWSVAKRYSTTVHALSHANKLTPTDTPDSKETLHGTRYLIIA